MRITKEFAKNKPALVALTTAVLLGTASLALAVSGEGEHHADSAVLLKDFLWRCLNFGVTFGLLAYFVTKPFKKGMAGRREDIEKALEQARNAQREAEAKFAEYDGKLTRATVEIEEIYAGIKKEGDLEREKILTNAREMAVKIRQEAEKTAANEVAKARSELREEAVRLAVRIAEDLLKKNITKEDHSRLVNEYMQKVGELH